jgi:hypothetical protein
VAGVIALAACNAAQNVSPSVGSAASSTSGPTGVMSDHGRKFKATYFGSYSKSGDCSATAMLNYNGDGSAKILRSSTERMKLRWYCGSQNASGSVTLTSDKHPRDSVTAGVSSTDFKSQCYGFNASFTITSGTGRFRYASGSGTIAVTTASNDCISYVYSDKWSGRLKL